MRANENQLSLGWKNGLSLAKWNFSGDGNLYRVSDASVIDSLPSYVRVVHLPVFFFAEIIVFQKTLSFRASLFVITVVIFCGNTLFHIL